MATHGSPTFQTYARNLRRIYWLEFIDIQTELSRARQEASVIDQDYPTPDTPLQDYAVPAED